MEKIVKKKGLDLQWQILFGIIAGIVVGLILNVASPSIPQSISGGIRALFSYGGDIFLRLLRMVIVPLVFSSIFMAVIRLGNIKELGKIGMYTIVYYFATTAIAVLLGLFLVNWVHPGQGIDPDVLSNLNIVKGIPEQVAAVQVGERSVFFIILDTIIDIIPKNVFAAFGSASILQIIFFALFFALITGLIGETENPLVAAVDCVDRVMQKAVALIMLCAPYCIFFLVCSLCMDLGFAALSALARYAVTVLLGLVVHSTICLPMLVAVFTRKNPFHLFRAVLPAVLTAWSTASSAATLPVTMDCCKKRAHLDERISNFVVTLGATINMDGTALYESVAVIFIAELLGIPLTIPMQIVIFFTATLAAIGAAAIPGAGLITMGIVLSAVGLPLEGIGLILVIDRILDQFRTAVNVWGDVTAAAVVGYIEGKRTAGNTAQSTSGAGMD